MIILFIGLYGALDPQIYRRGLTLLLGPSVRARGGAALAVAVLREAAQRLGRQADELHLGPGGVGMGVMIVLEVEKALMRRDGALRSDAPHPI